MENNTTEKFHTLDRNLKKIILSFLDRHHQRIIYWHNKKLRPLLPDYPLRINIDNIKKYCSFNLDSNVVKILEINDGIISCFYNQCIQHFNIVGDKQELIETFQKGCSFSGNCVQQEDGNIIFLSGKNNYLHIYDKDYKKIVENFQELENIWSICNLSGNSFALGLQDGNIKIYSRNPSSKKYEFKEYQNHACEVTSLVYLPKNNFLLSFSEDISLNVYNLTLEITIKSIVDYSSVTSIISINDDTFASASYKNLKIWSIKSIKSDTCIECIKTIDIHEEQINPMYDQYDILLYLLGKDFIVIRNRAIDDEFKIFDLKNYEFIKCLKEDSNIITLIITKNNSIITGTDDNKLNVWKILV